MPPTAVKRKPKPRKAELKTKVNDASVAKFIAGIPDEEKRADAAALVKVFAAATRKPPRMWGSAIVGYGSYHYLGKSGREGEWMVCGFSPRKAALTLYMLGGWQHTRPLLKALGKHSVGGGCLYIKRLSDIERPALKKLIAVSLKNSKQAAVLAASGDR